VRRALSLPFLSAMFYVTHCYEEEEAALLNSGFGFSLPAARMSDLNGHRLLRLRGTRMESLLGCHGAELWLDSDTASWAVIEEEEAAVAGDLSRGISYAALLLRLGRARQEGLNRLLGHFWRTGLLEVDGQSRWPADIFARGPIFRPSYLVEIHLTSRCNMACRYCFTESGFRGTDLPEDMARKAVDLALALPTDDLTIEFAGGEALLRLSLLRGLIERIERASAARSSPVHIAIQTNGLLLRGEALEFFAQHPSVEVGISLDGPRFVNDSARLANNGKGCHAAIEAAARAAVSLWGKESGALAVIHSESVSKPREIAAYFASLGLGKIRFNPMVRLGRGSTGGASLAISPAQYLSFMQEVLDYLAETHAFEESNLEALVRNLVVKSRDYRCMRSPCGAGYDYLVAAPTGDLYPCARFLYHPDLFLGNLNDGEGLEGRFMNSRLVCDMANRIVSRLPDCMDCAWRHFCGGGCALEAHAASGTLKAADPLCNYYQGIYPHLIRYLYEHPDMVEYFFPGAVACHVSPPAADIP
jgi:uncharacterized protein